MSQFEERPSGCGFSSWGPLTPTPAARKDRAMDKFKSVLASRKFWALLASLVAVAATYSSGAQDAPSLWHAIDLAVAAFSVYAVATGVESGLAASKG